MLATDERESTTKAPAPKPTTALNAAICKSIPA
jgi:hypothetical protein